MPPCFSLDTHGIQRYIQTPAHPRPGWLPVIRRRGQPGKNQNTGDEMKKIEAEVYSRVVGYFRPEKQANPGKREEIADRKQYDVKKIPSVVKSS